MSVTTTVDSSLHVFTLMLFVTKHVKLVKAFNLSSGQVLRSCDLSVAPEFYPDGEPQDTVIDLEQSQFDETNLILTCKAHGCPFPQYTWYRNGIDVTKLSTKLKDGEFGFNVSADNGVSKTGVKYYCLATSYFHGKPAGIRSREALVTYAYTDYTVTTPIVSHILAMAGGSLYLKCKMPISNPPLKVVTWLDGRGAEINDKISYLGGAEYDEGGKYLFIKEIDQIFFSRNNFYCKLSNGTGPPFLSRVVYKLFNDLRFQELDVYDYESDLSGLTGENITFRYVAHYKGTQTYRGPGIQLNCSHSRIVFYHSPLANVTLTVPQADSTNYIFSFSCAQQSINENRLDPVTFRLTVLKLPVIVSSSPDDDVVVKHELKGTLTLTCTVSALPPPTITWYHNGKAIMRSTKEIKIEGTTLRITRLSSSYFGIFQCSVATNHNGKTHVANRMWFLMIIEKPTDKNQLAFKLSVAVLVMLHTPSITWMVLFIIFNSIHGIFGCVKCYRAHRGKYSSEHHSSKDAGSSEVGTDHHTSSGRMAESDYEDGRGRAAQWKKRRRSTLSTRS